jgi:hypothetical protein
MLALLLRASQYGTALLPRIFMTLGAAQQFRSYF